MSIMRGVIAVGLTGLLIACTSGYETFQPPPLDFADRAPLRLEVGSVIVQSAYRSQDEPPFVDDLMPLEPEDAVRQLLEQRLLAVGGPGSVQAVILDASVKEEPLETRSGLSGFFTKESAARLEGQLQVQVDRLSPTGEVLASVSTAVSRTSSIPEDVGYAERQEIGYQLVRNLLDDLDTRLTENIRANLGAILAP